MWALQACCLTAAERRHEQTVLEVEQLVLHQMAEEEEPREGNSAELGREEGGEPDSTPASLQATKVRHSYSFICSLCEHLSFLRAGQM